MSTTNDVVSAVYQQSRLRFYTLLARFYRTEVDEELFAALQSENLEVLVEGIPDSVMPGLRQLQDYLHSPEASVLDLARDYAKVFCGASSTNKTAAYPFESVYTSAKGLLMQEARDEVLAWYRRFGLDKNDAWHDCEDHLGLELEFCTFLITESLRALEDGDTEGFLSLYANQAAFIKQHLANWVPGFARDVKRYAQTEFYQGLAAATVAWLSADLAALQEQFRACDVCVENPVEVKPPAENPAELI